MSMYESYKSISKKVTLKDVKELFKENEKTWSDFIRLDGQTIISNGCSVHVSCDLDSSVDLGQERKDIVSVFNI